MNHKFFLTALLLIGSICLSCDNEDENKLMGSISPIVEAELPTVGKVGQEINFIVSHLVFNGCGYYSSQETTQIGNTFTVTFYAEYRDGVCTTDIPTRKTNYKFSPTKADTYTFRFNSGETSYLVKSIEIH